MSFKNTLMLFCMFALFISTSNAQSLFTISKTGAEKNTFSISGFPSDPVSREYCETLKRNLIRSGEFQLTSNGSIKITPSAGGVKASGNGKSLSRRITAADGQSARMQARAFADDLVKTYTGHPGLSSKPITFLHRKNRFETEIWTCYADGRDIKRQMDCKCPAVCPKWAPNTRDIYYTGYHQNTPLVYKLDTVEGKSKLLAPFKGLAAGAAISPDSSLCALILSHQGNPELYSLNLAAKRVTRLTKTLNANEASPCWSADGRTIVYVSDLTRNPQIYAIDTATKKSRRITSQGKQNVNPDLSPDGKLTWASLRDGTWRIAVMDFSKGESSTRLVTQGGSWEHPSWAPDGRHVIASEKGTLFLVDTAEDGDDPVRLFNNKGEFYNADWAK